MPLPDGGGRNVVNVILVDFRGYDTLGEITVLAAAAIGTVALARAGRRPASRRTQAPSTAGPPCRRRVRVARLVTLEVSMRVLFTVVMVGSLYLLFVGHNQPGGGFVGRDRRRGGDRPALHQRRDRRGAAPVAGPAVARARRRAC